MKTIFTMILIFHFWNTIAQQSTLTDFEGNAYTIVKVGDQEWMGENLKTQHFSNGDKINRLEQSNDWTNDTIGGYCWFNNDTSFNKTYGPLYNWYAVKSTKGICPSGWHVPTQSELDTLRTLLGGIRIAGGKIKSKSDLWKLPNKNASNETGLTIEPSGNRNPIGGFLKMGYFGYFWSNTENKSDSLNAWAVNLSSRNGFMVLSSPSKKMDSQLDVLRIVNRMLISSKS